MNNAMESRTYLTVHYLQRNQVKAAGAKWDDTMKKWYADSGSDMKALKPWLPSQPEPVVQDPIDDFKSRMISIGLVVDGEHPIMDEVPRRIMAQGDSPNDPAGFYIGFKNGGIPGGYAKNNRTGEEVKWYGNSSTKYSFEERVAFRAQITAAKETAKAKDDQVQERVSRITLQRIAKDLIQIPANAPTPYLIKKNIPVTRDTFIGKDCTTTCIPRYDVTGKIWAMTYITPDGGKRYSKHGKRIGCFHVINGFNNLSHVPAIVIAEGYSTASTLATYLRFSTVAAFDNGNLIHVAMALREKFPEKPIIIAGDDDRFVKQQQGNNPGWEKATQAAAAVNGRAVFPGFTPEEMAEESKSYTDWNDLVNKSKIGKANILKQLDDAFGVYCNKAGV